jgi:glycosyltransferase involved in cell wall biosynthesis
VTPPPGALRVAILAESYLPYLSGVTVSVEALARGLGAAGHDVLLLAPRPAKGREPGTAGAVGPDPEVAWLPSVQLAMAPSDYRVPLPVPSEALRRAAAFRPEIVHANSPFVSGLMARRLARRRQAPLVFTHHTRFADYGHYLGPAARVGTGVMNTYLRRFWQGCAAVVAPGSDLAEQIRDGLGPASGVQVRVIPTGVDVAGIAGLTATDVRAAAGWEADAVVAVSLGRVAPEKSVGVLLDAFARAAVDDPRLRLLLVGGGPSETDVRTRARAPDLAGRVHVTGRLPRAAALAMVRGCDFFVFASQTETQGLVLAEALASGLPVVALDGPGVRDTVRDGVDGLIVPGGPSSERVTRLADAVELLAADADRRASLAATARDGAGRFSQDRRIEEMVNLYRELLASR